MDGRPHRQLVRVYAVFRSYMSDPSHFPHIKTNGLANYSVVRSSVLTTFTSLGASIAMRTCLTIMEYALYSILSILVLDLCGCQGQ